MAIQILRGNSTTRASSERVLEVGQPLYETDTHKLYVGDGTTQAKNLSCVTTDLAKNATNIQAKNGQYKSLATALLEMVYPIGSIYMSVNNTSPSTFLGGTWESWGSGRVPVGVDENDTIFEDAGKRGGEKEHQLITSEMPAHDHKGTYTDTQHYTINIPGTGLESIIEKPSGTDAFEVQYNQTQHASSVRHSNLPSGNQQDIDYQEKVTALYGVPLQGESAAHNNLQPYITCYMWKRTA